MFSRKNYTAKLTNTSTRMRKVAISETVLDKVSELRAFLTDELKLSFANITKFLPRKYSRVKIVLGKPSTYFLCGAAKNSPLPLKCYINNICAMSKYCLYSVSRSEVKTIFAKCSIVLLL